MYLGIDFSGGAKPWKERCSKPTVWIARVEGFATPRLVDLLPVQELSGRGPPFDRLVELLRTGAFLAAGIDAPFSIPAEYLPPGGHSALLACVGALPAAPDRPFPLGVTLVQIVAEVAPLLKAKPHRETERVWANCGVNTRSTLWNGPRGGAPFTAACLTLLARSERPIWPWNTGPGMLVEAFPAAQLKAWGGPHSGYGRPDQTDVREKILKVLARRLAFSAQQGTLMLDSPDALDAVIAAFAAIAADQQLRTGPYPVDGMIAVLDNPTLGLDGLSGVARRMSKPADDLT